MGEKITQKGPEMAPNRASDYVFRKSDLLVLQMLRSMNSGIRAVLITGAPGVGKTAFARAIAEEFGYQTEYYQANHWTSDEDLFVRVDVAAVAAISAGYQNIQLDQAYKPGCLLRATLKSQQSGCILILDEWDKTPERADALLLEFLQNGRIYGQFGEVWEADKSRLIVVITSNGIRQLSEPLLRRTFRYEMQYLPANVEADILRKQTGAKPGLIRLVLQMAWTIRTRGVSAVSMQECARMLETIQTIGVPDRETAEFIIRGWLVKQPEDWQALRNQFGNPAAVLKGEYDRC